MKIDCTAVIQCDHPGCDRQFILEQAWMKSPTEICNVAQENGWEQRLWMKIEPRMYCPTHTHKHTKINLALNSN